jgi:hypothetical protein
VCGGRARRVALEQTQDLGIGNKIYRGPDDTTRTSWPARHSMI